MPWNSVAIAAEAVRAITGLVCAGGDEGVVEIHVASLVTEGMRAGKGARALKGTWATIGRSRAPGPVREMDLPRENAKPARAMHGPAAMDQLSGLLSAPALKACECHLAISRVPLMRFRSVVWHRAARGEAGSTSSCGGVATVCTSSGPQPAFSVVFGRWCAVIAWSFRAARWMSQVARDTVF